MKITQKNIELALMLFIIIVATCAYRFGYMEYNKKAEDLNKESEVLVAKIDNLKVRIARQELVQGGLTEAEIRIDEILSKYGPGNTPEKTIMLVNEMEKSVGSEVGGKFKSDLSISSVSFGSDRVIFESSDRDANGLPRIRVYNNAMTISYATSYKGLKQFMDFINNYPERMNVLSFNANYNPENDGVSGSMVINLYSVEDMKHQYVAPDIKDVHIGKENIFETRMRY